MMSKRQMSAVFLAAALCMIAFPVTALAAGTETEEAVETEGAEAPETEGAIEGDEAVPTEGDIDEEALKELLGGSLEITMTEDGIVVGGGESAEESPDDSAGEETESSQMGLSQLMAEI